MKRITKKTIAETLKKNKDGSISKLQINSMEELIKYVKPNEKIYTYRSRGQGTNTRNVELISLSFLKEFTTFKTENDAPRGGILGEYIILTKKEYNLMIKRINYFVNVSY